MIRTLELYGLRPLAQAERLRELGLPGGKRSARWIARGWPRRTPHFALFDDLFDDDVTDMPARALAEQKLAESLAEVLESVGCARSSLSRPHAWLSPQGEDWKRGSRKRVREIADSALNGTEIMFRVARQRLAGIEASHGSIPAGYSAKTLGIVTILGTLGMLEAAAISERFDLPTGHNLDANDEILRARSCAALACDLSDCREEDIAGLGVIATRTEGNTTTVATLQECIRGRVFDWASYHPFGT